MVSYNNELTTIIYNFRITKTSQLTTNNLQLEYSVLIVEQK